MFGYTTDAAPAVVFPIASISPLLLFFVNAIVRSVIDVARARAKDDVVDPAQLAELTGRQVAVHGPVDAESSPVSIEIDAQKKTRVMKRAAFALRFPSAPAIEVIPSLSTRFFTAVQQGEEKAIAELRPEASVFVEGRLQKGWSIGQGAFRRPPDSMALQASLISTEPFSKYYRERARSWIRLLLPAATLLFLVGIFAFAFYGEVQSYRVIGKEIENGATYFKTPYGHGSGSYVRRSIAPETYERVRPGDMVREEFLGLYLFTFFTSALFAFGLSRSRRKVGLSLRG